MNVPNLITLARLASVVPITILIFAPFRGHFLYALVLTVLAMAADCADGIVARKLDQMTDFGGFFDPLTDKIFMYVVLFSLFRLDVFAAYVLLPMFVRDMLVDGLGNYCALRGGVAHANVQGKVKGWLQTIAVGLALLFLHTEQIGRESLLDYWANWTLVAAFLVSLHGLGAYVKELQNGNRNEGDVLRLGWTPRSAANP